MREGLSGYTPLERAHSKGPREAIPEPVSDALWHSSGSTGAAGVRQRAHAEENPAVPQAFTRPRPFPVDHSHPDRALVRDDTILRQRSQRGPGLHAPSICPQATHAASLGEDNRQLLPPQLPLFYRGLLLTSYWPILPSRASPCSPSLLPPL